MTVREIIYRLKELKPDAKLRMFDCFGNMYTSDFYTDSWRGSYDIPAALVNKVEDWSMCTSAKDAILELEDTNGKSVTGWKGGDYVLDDSDTLFLVSGWGTSGDSTTILEIYDDGYCELQTEAY